ncbi:MAG TPA: hypothetical protein VGQ20_17025 [Acidimicrobiales bacterium]|jgi:hypothetical protein|nr:hypothetical protein [Acidimicrobiales bacterium]
MTPLGLTVMRRTATLLHATPGLRARLRWQGDTLLEVGRPEPGEPEPAGRWLTPCAFRAAVGRAVRASHEGRTIAVLGLEPGNDPSLDLRARRGVLLPGGIVQLVSAGSLELAFATALDPASVERLIEPTVADVRAHHDAVTGATLVIHRGPAHPSAAALPAVLSDAQAVLARCAVAELDDRCAEFVHAVEPDHGHRSDRGQS